MTGVCLVLEKFFVLASKVFDNRFCQSLFILAKKTAKVVALSICLNVVSCNQSKLLIISDKTN